MPARRSSCVSAPAEYQAEYFTIPITCGPGRQVIPVDVFVMGCPRDPRLLSTALSRHLQNSNVLKEVNTDGRKPYPEQVVGESPAPAAAAYRNRIGENREGAKKIPIIILDRYRARMLKSCDKITDGDTLPAFFRHPGNDDGVDTPALTISASITGQSTANTRSPSVSVCRKPTVHPHDIGLIPGPSFPNGKNRSSSGSGSRNPGFKAVVPAR